MAKSQQTFNKKEREKKLKKKREDKVERREQRKLDKEERGKKTLEEQFSYVDEDGNLTSIPPDKHQRIEIQAEDIVLDNRRERENVITKEKTGIVKIFHADKGFGFITNLESGDSVFVHASNLTEPIKVNDKVSFILEKGPKGLMAGQVKKI